MARFENGKLVDGNAHYGEEIMREIPRGRRAVLVKDKVVKNIEPRKNYSPDDIARMKVMPDRSKGAESDYFGPRPEWSRRLLHEQIQAISQVIFCKYSPVDFDDDNYDWMVIEKYHLPNNWSRATAPLMLIFPTFYPQLPPVGFYLPDDISSPNGHLYSGAYHGASGAPIKNGWQWYCVYIDSGCWCPSFGSRPGDWRQGDNLFEYMTLVGEALSGNN